MNSRSDARWRGVSALNLEQFRMGTGAENAAPAVGPVVITELMICPPPVNGTNDSVTDEYVELFNASGIPQPLFDPEAGRDARYYRLRVEGMD